jgi:GT2 family glycosyltransferase
VVGPLILRGDRPELVWSAGGTLTWRENLSTLRGFERHDGPRWRESMDVDYIVGCAMLVRGEALEELGFFAVEYFAYMEDVDLCLRARRAGWEVHLVGEVAALHTPSSATGGGYSPRRKYMNAVNSVAFLRRHGRAVHWLRFWFFDVASLPLVWAIAVFRGRGKAVLAKGWGLLDGLRGRTVTAARVQDGACWLW